jgi:asparagine synthase (glutamine-hydrolysing)
MCGIAGYCGNGVRIGDAESLLRRMADAVAHRGPDAAGLLAVPGAGLAHRRLSIIGLADGQQPMSNAAGSLHVSFNGEIFNFVELRADLMARGHRFRTGSDTEVLLHLYQEFGADLVTRLNGDFAFALWDQRERVMLLARDRMGVRPLFYAASGKTLYFASEVKALLQVPGVETRIDHQVLDQIFTLWAPIAPQTMFAGIAELPPGHIALVRSGDVRVRPYWKLDFPDSGTTDRRSEGDVADELRELLADATRIRMRADVPVGSYLSGGLDSSIITALAAGQAPERLNTFSLTFDSAEHDESGFQQEMTAALRTKHAAVACGPGDIAGVFSDVIWHSERPIIRTAPAPMLMLSRLVRQKGIKVVLTGEGADELFAGYDIFKEARVRRFVARQPGSRLRPQLFRKLYPYLPGLRDQTPAYLSAFFGAETEFDDPLFSHQPRFRGTAATKMFFSADLRTSLAGYDAAADLASRLPERFSRWHPLHQAQYLETRFLLPGYILSSQGDRMAMANGVEGRFPFLDHRLVEFAARVPVGMTLKGLKEKYILRQATKDLVPPAVGGRTKQPYRAPDSQSFTGGMAPYATELLSSPAIARTGLFNPASVSKLAAKCLGVGASGFRDNAAFVGILSTQVWDQHFTSSFVAESACDGNRGGTYG